ncbi:MAG: energy transducer TonB [Lutibacter sp.]
MKNYLLLIFLLYSIIAFPQKIKTSDSLRQNQVEVFPIYKGCEKDKDKQRCFARKISLHISKNFRPENFQQIIKDYKVKKIFIQFNINKEGYIDSVKIESTHEKMEIEARRVINLIPRCIPGKTNNEPISVKYSLPITLKIEDIKKTTTRKTPWDKSSGRNY